MVIVIKRESDRNKSNIIIYVVVGFRNVAIPHLICVATLLGFNMATS